MHKRLPMMLVVALLVGGVAWYVSQQKSPTMEVASSLLLPGLMDRLNDTSKIVVESRDGSVTIVHEGGQWKVEEFGGYPAKPERVRQLLLQLGELRIVERKTAKAENFPQLEVEDRTSRDAASRAVKVLDDKGEPLVDLLVGKSRPARAMNPPGHYVRRAGEPNAWLVEGELAPGGQPTEWIETSVVDLPVDRVRQVNITPTGEKTIVVNKSSPEVQLFSLAEVPAGFEVRARATVSSMGGLLLDARLEGVLPAARFADQQPTATAVVETFDGLSATVRRFENKGEGFLTLEFAHTPDRVVAPVPPPSDAPKPKEMNEGPAPAGLKKPEEVAEEVEALNARVQGWAYRLPDYKTRLLEKKLDDLLKKKD